MVDLPSIQELHGASVDDLPGILFRKVLEVAATKPNDDVVAQNAAKLLGSVVDPHVVATAVQLYSVLHKNETNTAQQFLASILRKLDNTNKFRESFLEIVADTSLLEALGIPIGDVFPKKLRIVNTNVYARQHKFNLLMEESEGYSKFLYGASQEMDQLDVVIGAFSLDPNRCLDILLNLLAFAIRQNAPVEYLTITIQRLDTGKIPQLLGFMTQQRTVSDPKTNSSVDVVAVEDNDVLLIATHLIQHEIIQLDDILPFLKDDSINWPLVLDRVHQEYVRIETIRIQKINRISLASSAGNVAAAVEDPQVDVLKIRELLERLHVMKLILKLGKVAYQKKKLPNADWPKLATLFPDTIGLWILDHCVEILSEYYTDDDTTSMMMDVDDETELISRLEDPLRAVHEAGCLQYRPEFFIRLCRFIKEPAAWKGILKTVLLPTTSVFPPNPSIHLELWRVLEKFSYQDRYEMYEFWKEDMDKSVWMKEGEAMVLKDTRYSLRRLSKETVRDLSRAVAKCCFRNPIVVFTTILNQIESYDNLVGVMVDVCRFVTPLGLDVLGFCILQRLTAARRNRMKESGVHASQWLQSLESFTGTFYKRYPNVECQGLVSYIRRRLEDSQVIELGMLQVLLTTVGGFKFRDYSPIASLTVAQLEGRAGSTVLQRETMAFGVVEGIEWKSAKQIRKILQKDGPSLLILLAQVQYQIIFGGGDEMPVKLIGNLVDKCRVVMSILLDFLTNNRVDDKAIEDYANALPSFEDLFGEYEVEGAVVWQLYRPIFREAVSGEADGLQSFIPTERSRAFFKTMLPSMTWSHITVDLFETFSTTSLYDIHCPTEAYSTEIKRLEREMERLSQRKGPQPGAGDDATIDHAKKVVSDLNSDLLKQQNHVSETIDLFKKRRNKFMVQDQVSRDAAQRFFVNLIYPRCLQGPDDALYCAYFISELHRIEMTGFGTLLVYDCIIVTMTRALFGLTEGEAACASILLFEVWKVISSCRFDEKEFEDVFADKTGAIMTDNQVPISFEAYKKIYDKWHNEIAAACVGCLVSSEYIHLRNCLVVLSRIVDIYPTKPKVANKLLQKLEPLQEESNSMADIRAAARAYNMQMHQARDEGAWKEEDDATVKARLAQVEAAAAERHEKAKQAMAQIQKDSEKISEEIGEWTSRDRSRGRHDVDDRRPDSRRRHDDRRSAGVRPAPQGPQGGGQHPDRWQRDRAPQGMSRERDVAAPARMREEDTTRSYEVHPRGRGSDGSPGRHDGRKRSRPSSPMEQGEAREEPGSVSAAKRSRHETEEKPAETEGSSGRKSRPKYGRKFTHR